MKSLIFSLMLIVVSSLTLNAQESPDKLNPEEYFDFWIGTWELTWDEGDGITGSGTNTIERILDGNVIQENFRIEKGANTGFKGRSLSVFQPTQERWKQAWADNSGGYYDFTGSVEDDKRIFSTEQQELQDGRTLIQRMVFYDITEDSLKWDWESSTDNGENWTLNWRINYKRI